MKKLFYLIGAAAFITVACTEDVAFNPEKCGNGSVDAKETCDDANKVAGDGCSDQCQIEDGYHCPVNGAPCIKDACTPGQTQCVGQEQAVCNDSFQWDQAVACPNTEICDAVEQQCKEGGQPPEPAVLYSLEASVLELAPGASVQATASLNLAAENDKVVALSVAPVDFATLSTADLTIAKGQKSANFTVTASSLATKEADFTVTATLGSDTKTLNFKIVVQCKDGDYKCDTKEGVNTRFKCDAEGKWLEDPCGKSQICADTGKGAECIAQDACAGEQSICVYLGEISQTWTCTDASWVKKDCPNDCTLVDGVATCSEAACTEGQTRCSDNASATEVCDPETGTFVTKEMCKLPSICIVKDEQAMCSIPAKLEKLLPETADVLAGKTQVMEARLDKITDVDVQINTSAEGSCTIGARSVIVASGAQMTTFNVTINADAANNSTCKVTAKTSDVTKEATLTVKAQQCTGSATKCERGLLFTCVSGAWDKGKDCRSGQTCPVAETTCKDIKILEIEPNPITAYDGGTFTAEVVLNYPVYTPAYAVTLELVDEAVGFSLDIQPQSLSFKDGKERLAFTFSPSGHHPQNAFTIKASNGASSASLKVAYPECVDGQARCLSYLIQECSKGTWSVPKVCDEKGGSCVQATPSGKPECVTPKFSASLGKIVIDPITLVSGKNYPVYVRFDPARSSSIQVMASGTGVTVNHEPSGSGMGTGIYMFTPGTTERVMAMKTSIPGIQQPSLRVTAGTEVRIISFAIRNCNDGETRCEYNNNGSHSVEKCNARYQWRPDTRSCAAGTICSLYTSNCEDPAIIAVFPDNLVVSDITDIVPSVTVDFNAKITGTLDLKSADEQKTIRINNLSRETITIDKTKLKLNETTVFTLTLGASKKTFNVTLIP